MAGVGDARSRLERTTAVLGVLAAMTVAGTLAAALTLRAAPPGDEAGAAGADAGADAGGTVRRVVREVPQVSGLRLALELPDGAWSAGSPEAVAGYRRPGGHPTVVRGPVYFRRGWCAEDPRWSSRAFAGLVPRASGASPRRAGDRITLGWVRVVAAALGADASSGASPARASPVRIGDRTGWLTTRTVTLSGTGACLPPRVGVDALTLAVHGEVVAVVLVRDAGVPGALTPAGSAAFLAGTRVLAQSLRSRT